MVRSLIFAVSIGAAALQAGAHTSDDGAQLPDVDTLMVGADGYVKEFNQQNGVMRQEVESRQRESQNLIALRKKAMEENLTLLDARVIDAEQRNRKLQARIQELANSTQEQKAVVKRWKTSNDFLREALSALQQKVQVVHEFLIESVNNTDAAGVRDLEVLRQTTPRPTVETFLRDVQGQGDDSAVGEVSLLSTANAVSAGAALDGTRGGAQLQQGHQSQQRPGDVGIPDLIEHIQSLADAESEGEAQITGQYIAMRELGEERLRVAQADSKDLRKREEELLDLSRSLKLAVGHLKEAHTELLHRLSGMRRFAAQTYADNERQTKASWTALQEAMGRAAAVRSTPTNATTAAAPAAAAHATAAASSPTADSESRNARARERRHERWAKRHQANNGSA